VLSMTDNFSLEALAVCLVRGVRTIQGRLLVLMRVSERMVLISSTRNRLIERQIYFSTGSSWIIFDRLNYLGKDSLNNSEYFIS
jgi:hypothetical protein